MNQRHSPLIRLAPFGAVGLALAQPLHGATILSGTGLANNTTVPANHGSNAAGTPDITLSWTTADGGQWQAYNGWPNGGQVYQVDGNYGAATKPVFNVVFTPAVGFNVLLTSVTLNDWVGGGNPATTTINWSVTGSISGLLGSATNLLIPDASASTLNLPFQGIGGETLTFTITPQAGAGSYFAIDNLSFDQVAVPEPSGALLAATGLGALALRRRRK